MKRLFELYAEACRAAALRVSGDPDLAEEVVQKVFCNLPADLCSRVQEEGMAAYFYRAGVHEALRIQARRSRDAPLDAISTAAEPSTTPDPLRRVYLTELAATLSPYIEQLPPTQQDVIRLCDIEGLPRREAAAELGITVNALEQRRTRALANLRQALEDSAIAGFDDVCWDSS
ncbi:MAG: sigma-70 family RNA polymerase sigma factor [Gemmatimonadota bacterium]